MDWIWAHTSSHCDGCSCRSLSDTPATDTNHMGMPGTIMLSRGASRGRRAYGPWRAPDTAEWKRAAGYLLDKRAERDMQQRLDSWDALDKGKHPTNSDNSYTTVRLHADVARNMVRAALSSTS